MPNWENPNSRLVGNDGGSGKQNAGSLMPADPDGSNQQMTQQGSRDAVKGAGFESADLTSTGGSVGTR